jgi:hypothetical protein
VNLAKTTAAGSEKEIDKPLSNNVSSSSTEADGSLLKEADGSLLKEADGSLLKEADGSLLKEADGSTYPLLISQQKKFRGVIRFMTQEERQLNLVFMTINQSWHHVRQFISEYPAQVANIHGLVTLNGRQANSSKLRNRDMPVLAISTERRPSTTFTSGMSRRRGTLQTRYQQLYIPVSDLRFGFKENRLTKRVRGWLSLPVQGIEIYKN